MTFEKVISKQSNVVSDGTINMQFSKHGKIQYEIDGSLVTIQYHTKCTNPLYPKFTSNTFKVYIFLQPLPGHCLSQTSFHTHL